MATRKPTPHPPPPPQAELDAAFALDVDVRTQPPHLAADLIVLPSRAPVLLEAEATQRGVLPGLFRETSRTYRWAAEGGQLWGADQATSPGEAIYMPPPESRVVRLTAEATIELERLVAGGTQSVTVTKRAGLRVLTPVSGQALRGGLLDGYRIGEYLDPNDPSIVRRYNIESDWFRRYPDRFAVPEVFYKVTPELKDARISPNTRLGLFAIDFPWKSLGMPQYIALDMHLVQKLEDLLALMRADGHPVTEFHAIYGFRPPEFNLGKIDTEGDTTLKVPFSQHQYGRAIDLIIDEDGDGKMDDLNGDGAIDVHDAEVVMHYVNILDRQYRAEGRMAMVGGAGLYTHHDFLEREAAIGQTPYIHIDTRGFLNNNGNLVRWPDQWPDGTWIRWGSI